MKRAPFFYLLASGAEAWWDSGHALSMAVARQHLLSQGAGDVVDLVSAFLDVSKRQYPEWSTFVSAATFMDKIKTHTTLYSSMHYKDIPFASKGDDIKLEKLSEAELKAFLRNSTIVGAPMLLDSANTTLISKKVLADDYAPSEATDFALRAAVHVLGDIHQPLHSVGWYNDAFCDKSGCSSDQGGNKVGVDASALSQPLSQEFKNLHMLWDSMCGAYTRSVEDVEDSYFVSGALTLIHQHPAEQLGIDFSLTTYDPITIMQESYNMAVRQYRKGTFADGTPQRVYAMQHINFTNPTQPVLKLSDEYITWCQDATAQRVVLAGYRLASFLSDVAASTPAAALQRARRDGSASGSLQKFTLLSLVALSATQWL